VKKPPLVIATDKDDAEIAAARIVFPESCRRLCWCHVEKNFKKHYRGLDAAFMTRLEEISRIGHKDAAISALTNLLQEFQLTEHKYTPFAKKIMHGWCDAFSPHFFFGWARSTQGNESYHGRLKDRLNSASTLMECLDAIFELKKNETKIMPTMKRSCFDALHEARLSKRGTNLLDREVQAGLSNCSAERLPQENAWLVKDRLGWIYHVHEAEDGIQCDAYLPMDFVGKIRTTQANESQHARLKVELSSASTLCDCIRTMIKVKKDEVGISKHVFSSSLEPLFGAKRRLTRHAFMLLEGQFTRSLSMTSVFRRKEVSPECMEELWTTHDELYDHAFITTIVRNEFDKLSLHCNCNYGRPLLSRRDYPGSASSGLICLICCFLPRIISVSI
jgi:hypothetical protein